MERKEGKFGMAMPPDKMEALRQARHSAGIDEEENGEPSGPAQIVMRDEAFPDGIQEGTPLGLSKEVKQIVYALHWQFQKQILDIVQAALGHKEQQWLVVRKLMLDVSTTQIKTQLRAVQDRFYAEEKGTDGLKFQRRTEGD